MAALAFCKKVLIKVKRFIFNVFVDEFGILIFLIRPLQLSMFSSNNLLVCCHRKKVRSLLRNVITSQSSIFL